VKQWLWIFDFCSWDLFSFSLCETAGSRTTYRRHRWTII